VKILKREGKDRQQPLHACGFSELPQQHKIGWRR